MLAGPVTAMPLLLFAAAAQRLPLMTLGLLLYLNPGLQMAWGVLVGHEPMPTARWLGFALIWVALAVFTRRRADAAARRNCRRGCRSRWLRIVITVTGHFLTACRARLPG